MFLLLGSDQPDQAAVDVAYDSVASFGFGVGAPNHPPIREYVSSFGWPLNPYTEADQINYARSDFIREEMARSLSLEFPEPHPSRFKIHYLHIALFEPVNIRQPKYALVSEESLNSTTTRFIYRSHALARRP